jgi:hypothetical protein
MTTMLTLIAIVTFLAVVVHYAPAARYAPREDQERQLAELRGLSAYRQDPRI